ncbi:MULTISPECIES: N-acetylglucosamine kinase [unclassified Kitasatospora]|uniref:N-acetylglucosamine kinase n=1 Tax=unclassified Kitasatospora TaxID=2633591 RepID=UPI0038249AF8
MTLRLGIDAGGSHTRAVLTDRTGTVLGRGTAPGANAAGTDPATVTARLAAATAAALGDRAPGRITDCTIGLAGYRALPDPAALAARCRAALRLDVPVRLVPDTVPALASGGVTDGTGTVLIAGTGAICVRLDAGRTVEQHGGLGWLLGDEGGGFWLGRQALRHAHAHPRSALGALVRAHCADDPLRWAYDGPPRRLAELAAPVCRLAATGDPDARALTDTAADHLAALARATARPGEPLVLTGSVATSPGPVRTRLRHLLADLAPRLPTTDAATAAAALRPPGTPRRPGHGER